MRVQARCRPESQHPSIRDHRPSPPRSRQVDPGSEDGILHGFACPWRCRDGRDHSNVEIWSAARTDARVRSCRREREAARKRVERKHKFRGDVVAYVVINLFLIGLWAATGFGYFWPGWVLAGWGVLLLLDAWNVYYRRPITEDEIDEELRSRRR